MSIDNIDSSNEDIDYGLSIAEMLESGDPDLVEYAEQLKAEDGDKSAESADEPDATQSVETDEPKVEDDAVIETEKAVTEDNPDGISSRNGKHIIPYAELETTRQNLAEATRNLQSEKLLAEQSKVEIEKLHRQIELAKSKGVELPILPEDEEITDEALEELADISPEMGVLGRKMKMLLENHKAQTVNVDNAAQDVRTQNNESQYDPSTVQEQIAANPAIQAIMQDPQLSNLAIEIEKDLVDDPRYTSLDKRYAEVVKRVGGAKGIDFVAKYGPGATGGNPAKAPHEQSPLTPHSLSDIPSSSNANNAGKTSQEVLAEQSPEALLDSMEGMSMEQIEALIAG
jgi:hypothetical protein